MGNVILFLAIVLAGAWFTFYTAAHQAAGEANWASGACSAARVLCHSPQLLAYGAVGLAALWVVVKFMSAVRG
jgi:hypothetical protein